MRLTCEELERRDAPSAVQATTLGPRGRAERREPALTQEIELAVLVIKKEASLLAKDGQAQAGLNSLQAEAIALSNLLNPPPTSS